MKTLFGTIEYFEQEILNKPQDQTQHLSKDEILQSSYEQLEYEVLHNFICDEKVRLECLQNLVKAYERLHQKIVLY